jgi:hypothetical protein
MEPMKSELKQILVELQGPDLLTIHRGEEHLDRYLRTHRLLISSMLKVWLGLDGEADDVSTDSEA